MIKLIKFKYVVLIMILLLIIYIVTARIICTNSVEKQFYEAWLYGQQNYQNLGNGAFEKQAQIDYIGRVTLRNRCLEKWGLQ